MPKEKNYNPVQAQRKADKAREIRKGKAEAQERRNERLARKNPDRIQKQIEDLKAITKNGGKLTRHEEQLLEGLEKEVKAVTRARESLGDRAPTHNRPRNNNSDRGANFVALGKRRRNSNASSSEEDVPEDVKRIPMPRDTPPPIPKDVLDKWYAKRRARREAENAARREDEGVPKSIPKEAPVVEAKTVYEAKPMIRDLRKEAVSAFVPTSVKLKMEKGQGQGGLLEPEEADRLEREGYLKTNTTTSQQSRPTEPSRTMTMEEVDDEET